MKAWQEKLMGILFSRDRAMQLDATLRSFYLHCQDADQLALHIVYKTSNSTHQTQYAQLRRDYASFPHIFFHAQSKFHQDVLALLGNINQWNVRWLYLASLPLGHRFRKINQAWLKALPEGFVLFLVDDNLFIRDFSLAEAITTLHDDERALGISLRLGRNTRYSYTIDREQNLPIFEQAAPTILNFSWQDQDGDFGYPLEISSSIYRIADLLPLLNQQWFANPNQLESWLSRSSSSFLHRPFLLCFPQSVTFCNPVNMVQQECKNRSGDFHDYSSDELAEKFSHGQRIDVAAYDGFVPAGCHQEVELKFFHPAAAHA